MDVNSPSMIIPFGRVVGAAEISPPNAVNAVESLIDWMITQVPDCNPSELVKTSLYPLAFRTIVGLLINHPLVVWCIDVMRLILCVLKLLSLTLQFVNLQEQGLLCLGVGKLGGAVLLACPQPIGVSSLDDVL